MMRVFMNTLSCSTASWYTAYGDANDVVVLRFPTHVDARNVRTSYIEKVISGSVSVILRANSYPLPLLRNRRRHCCYHPRHILRRRRHRIHHYHSCPPYLH